IRILFFFFFFSSRRRHTRSLCDWSSDVCSSDLGPPPTPWSATWTRSSPTTRSEERREGKSVDLGGRRIIKKKKKKNKIKDKVICKLTKTPYNKKKVNRSK